MQALLSTFFEQPFLSIILSPEGPNIGSGNIESFGESKVRVAIHGVNKTCGTVATIPDSENAIPALHSELRACGYEYSGRYECFLAAGEELA